jgi:glycosyltransferase involved in cell wall biosynthesis
MKISVITASHNSRSNAFNRVSEALSQQTLPKPQWQWIVIDNASEKPLSARKDCVFPDNARIVRNEVAANDASLVDARCRGIRESVGPVIVFVDDDNVLALDYLARVVEISVTWPQLGTWGGNIVLEYEDPSLKLPDELEPLLCARSVNEPVWSNVKNHHGSTPWGAGLCIRREIALAYLDRLEAEPDRRRLDPVGTEMRFGGDTDMVYTGLKMGYGKGVFPKLSLVHLIPAGRCKPDYLERALEAHGYSSSLHGWLDSGVVERPRSDLRFWLGEALRWPRYSPAERMRRRAWRKGARRAYNELKDRSPRRENRAP